MSSDSGSADALEFMKNIWGQMGFTVPGMVTPTLDTDELERRIKDLRAVEGWLRTNLAMLQATIQGLEVQHATLASLKAMSERMRAPAAGAQEEPASEAMPNPFNPAMLWPWNLVPPAEPAAPEAESATPPKSTRSRKPRKDSADE